MIYDMKGVVKLSIGAAECCMHGQMRSQPKCHKLRTCKARLAYIKWLKV